MANIDWNFDTFEAQIESSLGPHLPSWTQVVHIWYTVQNFHRFYF